MPGPAVDILQQFGNVEDDQRYTRLVDLFADDAVYYDPFFGAQRGKTAIRKFMNHMEEVVPGSGATFSSWHTEADTDCGWARWEMVAPNADGESVAVPGQSLYRLRDGKVTFVADYLDCGAYRALRGPDAKVPDHASSIGLSASDDVFDGSAVDVLRQAWQIQQAEHYSSIADLFDDDGVYADPANGEFRGRESITAFFLRAQAAMRAVGGTFELVDLAGDTNVGWTQWWLNLPDRKVPGWSLHTFRDRKISIDYDFLDTNVAGSLIVP